LIGIQTDIYLATIWARATYAMGSLARAMGDASIAKKVSTDYQKLLQTFDKKLWDEEIDYYSYAFTSEGKRIKKLIPWSPVRLMWELGESLHKKLILKNRPSRASYRPGTQDSFSQISLYGPLNYNYGTVWLFLTGKVATTQFKHNFYLTKEIDRSEALLAIALIIP